MCMLYWLISLWLQSYSLSQGHACWKSRGLPVDHCICPFKVPHRGFDLRRKCLWNVPEKKILDRTGLRDQLCPYWLTDEIWSSSAGTMMRLRLAVMHRNWQKTVVIARLKSINRFPLSGYWNDNEGKYLLITFSFSSAAAFFVNVSPPFRQEPVSLPGMPAKDNSRCRQMKYGNAGANGEVITIKFGVHRKTCGDSRQIHRGICRHIRCGSQRCSGLLTHFLSGYKSLFIQIHF